MTSGCRSHIDTHYRAPAHTHARIHTQTCGPGIMEKRPPDADDEQQQKGHNYTTTHEHTYTKRQSELLKQRCRLDEGKHIGTYRQMDTRDGARAAVPRDASYVWRDQTCSYVMVCQLVFSFFLIFFLSVKLSFSLKQKLHGIVAQSLRGHCNGFTKLQG